MSHSCTLRKFRLRTALVNNGAVVVQMSAVRVFGRVGSAGDIQPGVRRSGGQNCLQVDVAVF